MMGIVSYNTVSGRSNPAFIAILAASREGGSSTRTTHTFCFAMVFASCCYPYHRTNNMACTRHGSYNHNIRWYLVDSSSFQIVWDERVEAPPAVGATTPPLLCGSCLPLIDSCDVSLCTDKGRISHTSFLPLMSYRF